MENRHALILILVLQLALLGSRGADGTSPEVPGATNAESAILAAETNLAAGSAEIAASEATLTALKTWRAMLQIQGQLDMTLLAMERNRREAESLAERHKAELAEKLKAELQDRLVSMERTLQSQRERERITLLDSNQKMLLLVGIVAGVGLLAMLLASIFHLRAMKGFTRLIAPPPSRLTGDQFAADPSLDEEPRVLTEKTATAGNTRLLDAIETLEKRVVELEHTSSPVAPSPATGVNAETIANNGSSSHPKTETHDAGKSAPGEEKKEPDEAPAPVHGPEDLSVFLGKGQALLSLGKAEAALACFDEALKFFPDEAEIFVKKGSVLEKLEQWDEAIDCYDRAIALKKDLTLAYLFKGGVCNRMERYDEALVCYEQALKTQHRPGSKKA